MEHILSKFSCDGLYPKSAQVLLWIGTAIAIIITATWALIGFHKHDEYTTQREFSRIIASQTKIENRVNSLSANIYDQTMILNELKGRIEWLLQQEH